MKKILTSTWFAVVIGLVVFAGTIAKLWHPTAAAPAETETAGTNQTAEAKPAEDIVQQALAPPPIEVAPIAPAADNQVGEPGSLRFNDPQLKQYQTELQLKEDALDKREKGINRLADAVRLDLENLSVITNSWAKAMSDMRNAMTNRNIVIEDAKVTGLKTMAKVFTNMPPAAAISSLDNLGIETASAIISYMSIPSQSLILQEYSSKTNTNLKASDLSSAILKLTPPAKLP